MDNRLTTLYFAGAVSPQEHSDAMKRTFSALFESGGITYSQFLFPYVDSLLLSDDSTAPLFGSHALLWGVSAERLKQALDSLGEAECDRLSPQISCVDCSSGEIASFLGESVPADGTAALDGYSRLLGGLVRPWSLREHSRGMCSFAEHIARMRGYRVHGFSGGVLIISTEDGTEIDERQLAALFESKTGGILRIIR